MAILFLSIKYHNPQFIRERVLVMNIDVNIPLSHMLASDIGHNSEEMTIRTVISIPHDYYTQPRLESPHLLS